MGGHVYVLQEQIKSIKSIFLKALFTNNANI